MILVLITVVSLIFMIKFLYPKPMPPWASDLSYFPLCFWKISDTNQMERRPSSEKPGVLEENGQASLLDLPELPLQCILERLTPAGLCNMASVCSSLRERCTGDHFWKRHMEQKWGSVLSSAAIREWQRSMGSKKNSDPSKTPEGQDLTRFIGQMWPFAGFSSEFDHAKIKQKSSLPEDSIMSWYLALETGKFWFLAQVYNRENGHVGFLLSCYDAELSYDSQTDTFKAKYPPHGKRAAAIENNIEWVRVRTAPVDASPHELHISDCLTDLRPGDHIEIQWRRNKEFPYGWWYGVVGHLESCDGYEYYCQCHENDTVALEFRQYAPGSRWRRSTVSRKDHQEVGDEADGFYGGVRKLYRHQEIAVWDCLRPEDTLG